MARDYAQRGGNRRQTRSGGLPGWVFLVGGLSVGLAVAALVYVARPGGGSRDGVAVEAPAAPKGERRRNDPPVPIPPKEKPRFTFYEILPNQEVVVPRETARSAPTTAGAAGTYYIQVASYKARDEAERQKAQLALLGVESKIESVTIDRKDTYYRVRVGPEHDWNRVQLLMGRLEDNGINSLLVKVQ